MGVFIPDPLSDQDKPVKGSRRESKELEEEKLRDEEEVLLSDPTGVERGVKGCCTGQTNTMVELVCLEHSYKQVGIHACDPHPVRTSYTLA